MLCRKAQNSTLASFRIALCVVQLCVVLASTVEHGSRVAERSSPRARFAVANGHAPHDPISIISNAELVSQGWPGSGTPANPYRIEGLSINQTGVTRISISQTSAHILIQNCGPV